MLDQKRREDQLECPTDRESLGDYGGAGLEEPGGLLEEPEWKGMEDHWKCHTATALPNYHQGLGLTEGPVGPI